jgi:CHAT domain-containing protein
MILARQISFSALILDTGMASSRSRYAHPIFWAPFTQVGDGGG